MAPRKESELKVSEKKHFKLLERRIEKNEIKDLKRLKAALNGLVRQQANLKAKLDMAERYSPGEVEQTMEQLQEVNSRLAKSNALTQIYIATKLADPAWDAANTGE